VTSRFWLSIPALLAALALLAGCGGSGKNKGPFSATPTTTTPSGTTGPSGSSGSSGPSGVSGSAGPTGSAGSKPSTGGQDTKSGGNAAPTQPTPRSRTHGRKRTSEKECVKIAHRVFARHGNLRKELRKAGCGYTVK